MNARERLQHIMNHPNYRRSVMEPEGSTSYDGHEDAAALRELDQLLIECQETLLTWVDEKPVYELVIRLAQAGYGEK